jgi:RNA polymerase sigma-70 factor (ECF subfamily)
VTIKVGKGESDRCPVRRHQKAIQRQRLARVQRALAACPPSARQVFEYVYGHPELTYEQVALKFQLSAQRTKQIVCEIRKRLREALEEA